MRVLQQNLSERAATEHVSPHRLRHSNYNIQDMLADARMNLLGDNVGLFEVSVQIACAAQGTTPGRRTPNPNAFARAVSSQ